MSHASSTSDRYSGRIAAPKRPSAEAAGMLEMDLEESKDGHLEVHHDDFEKSFGVRKAVAELTWDEIRKLRAKEDGS